MSLCASDLRQVGGSSAEFGILACEYVPKERLLNVSTIILQIRSRGIMDNGKQVSIWAEHQGSTQDYGSSYYSQSKDINLYIDRAHVS